MAVILKHSMANAPKEELAARAATMKMTGIGINKQVQILREETGWPITVTYIEKQLQPTDMYQKMVKTLNDGIIRKNKSDYQKYCSEMLSLVQEKLLQLVKEGDTKAISLVLKSVGIETPEQEQKQSSNITVVMPGVALKKERDVSND